MISLERLTKKIKRLKAKRIKLYGKDWQINTYSSYKIKRWDAKDKLFFARKIESYRALHDLSISELSRRMGVHRGVFSRLEKSCINSPNQKLIYDFFLKKESDDNT